jgi:cold shock CspA family protein
MDYLKLRLRDVPDRDHAEGVIRELMGKLERHCQHITSCQVSVESPNAHPSSGARWRVRIELHAAGSEPIVVRREPGDGAIYEDLGTILHDAFHVADRQCKELTRRQRGEVKHHPAQELQGVVQELHPDHGILFSVDGRKIYFHEHALVDFTFDDLRVGMGVAYSETPGREGPQASTVRVVDSRAGIRTMERELPS